MLHVVESVNSTVNGIVWGIPAIVCILGVGFYLTIRTKFIQVVKFPYAMKQTLGKMFNKQEAAEGAMSPFQAVCTALAGTVGTGNIAGVAGAIALGGPGAVFWMWCSAFFGMCTKFAEVTLAVHFRKRNEEGDFVGGPMYNIVHGLGEKWRPLAMFYCAFGLLATMGIGNTAQINTIVTSIDSAIVSFVDVGDGAISAMNLGIGIVLAILLALVLVGGVKRIGKLTELLIPFMAILYILLALGVVVLNIEKVPEVFRDIIYGAFNPQAVTGGVVGSVFMCIRKGVSRGIFSNEAGLGTGSIAHACADTDSAPRQGMFGIFEVFCDTIVICTLTALVILCGGDAINFGTAVGAEVTIQGFVNTYGTWVTIFTAIAMCCFAFSTVIGWGLYGSRCFEFLFGGKFLKLFLLFDAAIVIFGATADVGLIWDLSDTFNGLMVIPNLIGVILLSGTVLRLTTEHFEREARLQNR